MTRNKGASLDELHPRQKAKVRKDKFKIQSSKSQISTNNPMTETKKSST
jgi:hypothetical protein